MKILISQDLSNIEELKDYIRFSSIAIKDIVEGVNGRLSFVENLQADLRTLNFTSINTNVTTAHSLRRIPTGYLVISRSTDMIIFDGSISNTTTTLTVRSSKIGVATLLVI